MAKLAPREERVHGLAEIRDMKLRLAALFDDPGVASWFDAVTDGLLGKLLNAGPTEDDLRRALACEISVLNRLRNYLLTAEADGLRAAEAIAKLERDVS